LNAIPKTGALVVVANHPYGVLDGLIINQLMSNVRTDFKVLTNGVLCKAPEANANLLPIDFDETEDALKTNLQTRKAAREILKNGGCIVVFPAGGVSSTPTWRDKVAQDTEWQPFIGSLIHRSKADVLPIFFEGQNSRLFQVIGAISLTARTALYFKELADRIGSRVGVAIGDTIPYHSLEKFPEKRDLLKHLRQETYRLGGMDSLPLARPAYRLNSRAHLNSQ
jgi:putative hemolysin